MNKIGILGGTFNPVHMGHLLLGRSAAEAFGLAKVLLIPCSVPAHKGERELISSEHRMAMVQAAIEGDLLFEASDIEIRRGGVSYAVDTVAQVHEHYTATELFWIIGADTLPELHMWKRIKDLLGMCRFITFSRPGLDVSKLTPESLKLDPPWPKKLFDDIRPGRPMQVSSSEIRHRVAEGMSIRYLVPRAVEMYIAEHGLYA